MTHAREREVKFSVNFKDRRHYDRVISYNMSVSEFVNDITDTV